MNWTSTVIVMPIYMIIRRAVPVPVRLLPEVRGRVVLVDPACIMIMCSIVLAFIIIMGYPSRTVFLVTSSVGTQ